MSLKTRHLLREYVQEFLKEKNERKRAITLTPGDRFVKYIGDRDVWVVLERPTQKTSGGRDWVSVKAYREGDTPEFATTHQFPGFNFDVEAFNESLNEDDYGDLALSDAATGGYGMHFGSGEDLYKIFVKPFTDVVQTAAGKTKELSQKGQTLLKTTYEAMFQSLIPFFEDRYSEIFTEEAKQIAKIRQEYGKVYKDTWEAFNNHDLLVAAFMYRPDLFMTATTAKNAPKAVGKLLSVLSGGRLDKALQQFNVLKKSPDKIKWSKAIEGPGIPIEGVIREAGEQQDNNQDPPLVRLVNDKRVKKILANSQVVQQMTKAGKALIQGTLKKVFKDAQSVMSAKNLTDLQQKIGKKLPGMEKLQAIPQQERQGVEAALLTTAKKTMKDFYARSLEAQVQAAVKAGVPQQHPYVQDYQRVIGKIKAL